MKVNEEIKEAFLFVSADSRYKFYLNDKYMGRGIAKCDPKFQYYDVHKIERLRRGKNVFAFLIHHYGEETFSYLLGRGGFLCQIEIEYKNGKRQVIGTDETWMVKRNEAFNQGAPRSTIQMGFQEIYDAGREIEGWQTLNLDHSSWEEASVIGKVGMKPWKNLTKRDIPFLKEERIYPIRVVEIGECPQKIDLNNIKEISSIMDKEMHLPLDKKKFKGIDNILKKGKSCFTIPASRDKSTYLVLDFGREVTGFPRISLEGVKGGIIDFGYDELLIDGRVYPSRNIDPEKEGEVKYAVCDRYIMKDGYQKHEQAFTWRGFRYMELVFRNCKRPVRLQSISLNHYCYPCQYRGAFQCSDPMLNRIWQVGGHTLKMCMHDSYEDCPWREQAQWMGDMRVEALANYYCFGDEKLIKKGLRQIAESQLHRRDGLMYPLAPGGVYGSSAHKKPVGLIPSFCLIWILSVYDYYLYTGDKRLLKTLYPNLKELLKAFIQPLSERSLISPEYWTDSPDWVWPFIDWASLDTKGENTALNCFLYEALRKAKEIALVNNDKENREKYKKFAEKVRKGINKNLWSEEKQLYADGFHDGKKSKVFSQQANCLAVLFDIAPKEKQEEIMEKIEKEEVVKINTPYFMFYFLSALIHNGKHKEAVEIIRNRWGEMVGKGATTFWEYFRGTEDVRMGSFCHAWSSCPTFILSQEILGVKPLKPGFKEILIEPHFLGLNYARGVVPSTFGDIKVWWRKIREKIKIEVVIPEGRKGILVINKKSYPFFKKISITGSSEE